MRTEAFFHRFSAYDRQGSIKKIKSVPFQTVSLLFFPDHVNNVRILTRVSQVAGKSNSVLLWLCSLVNVYLVKKLKDSRHLAMAQII